MHKKSYLELMLKNNICSDPIDPGRIEWYKILQILSNMYNKHTIKDAVKMAEKSTYCDCVWFTNTISKRTRNKAVSFNSGTINKVFEEEADETKDSRALFIIKTMENSSLSKERITQWYNETKDEYSTFCMMENTKVNSYSRGSFLGICSELCKFDNPFALGVIATIFPWLANMNLPLEIKYYKRAADLGHFKSMHEYASKIGSGDIDYFKYVSQYILYTGMRHDYFIIIKAQIREFKENPSNALSPIVFRIGEVARNHYYSTNTLGYKIFDVSCSYEEYSAVLLAVDLYNKNIECTKTAITCWTIIGNKVGIVKDVRKIISKLIWQSRYEALYLKE